MNATPIDERGTGSRQMMIRPQALEVVTPYGEETHPNIQPYLAVNYIIALQGIFPSRG